ncbi:MAG: Dps family protein [Candidatus Tectimicrobiota bacterium]
MQPNIGLALTQLTGVAEILNTLLADEFVLYTKTRNYHWHVTGPQFHQLHLFFEEQYNALNTIVDDVAERVRSLGNKAFSTLQEFVQAARLQEAPGEYPAAQRMLANLLADHETVIQQLRGDVQTSLDTYQDVGTSDFLTGLLEQHEKMAWMLRAHLEGSAA